MKEMIVIYLYLYLYLYLYQYQSMVDQSMELNKYISDISQWLYNWCFMLVVKPGGNR